MPISNKEYHEEEIRLAKVVDIIRNRISSLGSELIEDEEKQLEFKKFLWDSHTDMDPQELKTMMSDNDVEISILMSRGAYLQKLYRVQNKPYFGRIVFDSLDDGIQDIYIGITHVEDNLEYYVHDWRSPICSLFYDYELGDASYLAPDGIISGTILKKRQYTIENAKLLHIFDNEINIDDELLQEVLATESSDKMKNIVNTIQKEQNKIIRNVNDKNLIVQGIAGSGKTSVALHRIAFLLYKFKELNSNNILILSPNKVFSQYISNVLPELGEENTKETSLHIFLMSYLKEFKRVESITSFIENYYQNRDIVDYDLIKYKLSDDIVNDMDRYINNYVNNIIFIDDIITRDITITKIELNNILKTKYQHFTIIERLNVIAEKICDWNFNGKYTKKKQVLKMLMDRLNVNINYIDIYNDFYNSKYSKYKRSNKQIISKKIIKYEDATILIYMKSLLEGINYNTDIREVIIDEAQDYTLMQYKLLFKIFKRANYTILGDVNQTINPYYKYDSLNIIKDMLDSSNYLELTKTYRSSEEIIEYTNKILDISHVSAIRRGEREEVILRNNISNEIDCLYNDIINLQNKYKSIAVITKTDNEANYIYGELKDKIDITFIDKDSDNYSRKLVILPSYISKGLEFDAVIIYTDKDNYYINDEKYLYYVACTRAQHKLIVYNQK